MVAEGIVIVERTVKVERGTVLFRGDLYGAFRLVGAPAVVWYADNTFTPGQTWEQRHDGVQVCGARVAATFRPDES